MSSPWLLQKRRLHHFCQSSFPLIRHHRRRHRHFCRCHHHRHRCPEFRRRHYLHRLHLFRGKQSVKRVL